MAVYKEPNKDLRKYYYIFIEGAIALALVIFLVAFSIDLKADSKDADLTNKQDVVKMEEIVQTQHEKTPPPPPRPQVPVEVPNDEIVEDEAINLSTELNMDDRLDVPPPPKQDEEDEEQVFVVVEKQPELIGGLSSLQQKINYPDMARRAGIEGRVYVQFVVNKKGQVENPRIIRGIGGGCDKEALRVIKDAKFSPGMQRGRPVKVQYSLPIVFRLQN